MLEHDGKTLKALFVSDDNWCSLVGKVLIVLNGGYTMDANQYLVKLHT